MTSSATPGEPKLQFTLVGIPFEVRSSFLVMALVFGAAGGLRSTFHVLGWVLVVFISVAWHELGHAVVARVFGHSPRIELYGRGGLTHVGNVEVWWKDVAITLAGPGAGLLLGGLVWTTNALRLPLDARVVWVVDALLWANVWWSLLNLLPVIPYDGGLILRAIVERWVPHGRWIAQGISVSVGFVGGVYALAKGHLWIAYLAGHAIYLGAGELRRLRWEGRLSDAWAAWKSGDFARAQRSASLVFDSAGTDSVRAAATELWVWALLARGELSQAQVELKRMPSGHSPSEILVLTVGLLDGQEPPGAADEVRAELYWMWQALVFAWRDAGRPELAVRLFTPGMSARVPREVSIHVTAALFHAGHIDACATISERVFEAQHHPDDAYNLACCDCRRGRLDEAFRWLQTALDGGYRDLEHLEADSDLAAIRTTDGYRALLLARRETPQPG